MVNFMLKKILFSLCILAIFISFQKVSAQDVWIYTTDGVEYYVMNETAENNSRPGCVIIDVKVKNVSNAEIKGIQNYHFELTEGSSRYSIDGAEHDWKHSNIITQKVCVYCLNYLGINVGKVLSMTD